MRAFFGVILLSGYVPVPRRRMFWEKSADTRNELVANAIPRDRFEFIFSNLHCCDNNDLNINDKFAKVQEYAPFHETHSVDESMIPYFGKHNCKQFIKGKSIRYGCKFWMGSTSSGYCIWMKPYQGANCKFWMGSTSSGYCIWMKPYQGANSKMNENYRTFGVGPSVVLQYCDVLRRFEPFPFHVFFDNYFTTVPLLEELSSSIAMFSVDLNHFRSMFSLTTILQPYPYWKNYLVEKFELRAP
ncbi:Transposase IS4 [Popillia japonica]|uniref:Transposase IS4 n=1 Tax=Popillia japonica TaxID=7064 RepID=A0AAW1LQM9_POPJA